MTFHVRFATFRFFLSLSCLFMTSLPEAALATTSRFATEALPIELGDTLRGAGRAAGEPECFRLETPSAGLLMLDVAVPGTSETEPRLGLLGRGDGRPLAIVEQSASHVLAITDGPRSLVACVGAQDPRRRMGEYKLRTAFEAVVFDKSTDPEEIEVEPEGLTACGFLTKSTDPEEIEVEPEGLTACGFLTKSTDPEEIEVEPEGLTACGFLTKSTDPEEIEVEPEGFRVSDPFAGLCGAGEIDDHGDSFLCATPVALGRGVSGEIHGGGGDDYDLFAFELTAPETVNVETSGEVDTFGGLYDRRGQRLAAAAEGGRDGNFRLVKSLPPGMYFVRVEAQDWDQGAYALTVDGLPAAW